MKKQNKILLCYSRQKQTDSEKEEKRKMISEEIDGKKKWKIKGRAGFLKIIKVKSEIKKGYHYQFYRNLKGL